MRFISFSRYCFILLISLVLFACSPTPTDPIVTVENGKLRGVDQDGIQSFKGIPFAAPPVERLRWQPPQPTSNWDGIRSAENYAPTCPQISGPSAWFELPDISEDCLTLNVWTTEANNSKAKLPVMVSIHGGGFMTGSGNIARQDGSALAKKGVVFVSINYRLGVFGFLTHPALAAMNPDQPQGNYGLQDARAALEWVQRNIAAFGGDPKTVTIFGTSAGGDTVNHLMVMPAGEGLFQRAISQSASTGIALGSYTDRVVGFTPPTDKLGESFAKRMGVAEADDIGAALYSLTMEEIVNKMTDMDRYPPVVDGIVIPDQLGTLFAEGRHHKVPYITGTNSYEAALGYQVGGNSFSPQMFARLVRPEDKARLYPDMDQRQTEDAIFADLIMHAGSRHIAENMHAAEQPVFRYYLSYVADARRDTQPGAAHGDDVAFVLQTLEAELDLDESNISAQDREVSDLMSDYWVQFAKTGNPNRDGLPAWPSYSPETGNTLEIGDKVTVREYFIEDRSRFHLDNAKDLLMRATQK